MRLAIWLLVTGALALAGCRSQAANPVPAAEGMPAAEELPAAYPDLGEAPELGNEIWINVPEPLRLADLRGKVVLIDMWTFG
jgi:hypothetical protein